MTYLACSLKSDLWRALALPFRKSKYVSKGLEELPETTARAQADQVTPPTAVLLGQQNRYGKG